MMLRKLYKLCGVELRC